jgi:alkaline phosphatase D
MKKISILLILLITQNSFSQIKSGPMLGYSDMREVMLWIQTEKAAKVKIAYWEQEKPTVKMFTEEILTLKENAFAAKLLADEVLPSKKYGYEVYVNNKLQKFNYPLTFQTQTLWQYRTDPPEFKFALGSCVYINEERFDRPGTPYGKGTEVFNKIHEQKPNFMIWGGDNIYLREADWGTKTGINHRYSEMRKTKDMQALLASTHHYAIWDDHDFGPNNSDRSWINKDLTLAAFKNFWANPNYVFKDEGVTGTFMWEDCQFFLVDDMYFRAPNDIKDPNRDYLGEKQLNWLIEALKSSNAPFKFVVCGGQIINSAVVFENMSTYPAERKKLLDRLLAEKISGVVFFSGDRHHTVLQKMDRENIYPLYDLTVSPLTSGGAKPIDEEFKSGNIMKGYETYSKQTFAMLEITGKRLERVLKINILDSKGEKQWDYTIKASELQAK